MSSVTQWLKQKASQFSNLSTPKKGLCILGFFVGVQILLYINQRFNSQKQQTQQIIQRNIKNYDTKKALQHGEYSTIDDQNPLMSKYTEIVQRFIEKIRNDEVLSKVFDPQELVKGTILCKEIESYFLMSMGGPFIKENLNFLDGLIRENKISVEHQGRWIELWRETLREVKVEDKNIWEDFKFANTDEEEMEE